MAPSNRSKGKLDSTDQFLSERKALVLKETSITAKPIPFVKSTEKSTQTLLWSKVSAIVCFPKAQCGLLGYSLVCQRNKQEILNTNVSFYRILWVLNFFQAKLVSLDRPALIASCTFISYASFNSKPSYCQAKDSPSIAWIMFPENWGQDKAFPDWISLTPPTPPRPHDTAGQKTEGPFPE